jgi:aromatic-L-amino-acid decarboxylase
MPDMPSDEFRHYGHEVIDWIANYLADPARYPAMARVQPGDVTRSLAGPFPEAPEALDDILADFRDKVLPGVTHWNHPGFFAYFSSSGAGPGVLAEALTAALNVNAMLWRSSPAATELEELATDWLRQMLGLPVGFHGHIQDSASTSTLVALAAARETADPEVRTQGLAGRAPLRVYCSREGHSSIDKASITLGLGSENVQHIETDAAYRMDPGALEAAIERDLRVGLRPCCVVATIGTTSTTSIDPVAAVAEICARHNLWLHVDAAYGGSAAMIPEMRDGMSGWERADSIVVNPHKWLFVPLDCSVLFVRNPETVRRAFSLVPDYLMTPEQGQVTNLMDYGPALGRRFRALKLWVTLRYFGRAGLAKRIGEHVAMGRTFAAWIGDAPAWELAAPVPFSTVCFRFAPPGVDAAALNALNQGILEEVNRSGDVFLSSTRLGGKFTLRLAVGNVRTEVPNVEKAWELLMAAAQRIYPRYRTSPSDHSD